MTSNSEKRAEADRIFRLANPEPAQGDLFDPSVEWLAWDERRRAAHLAVAPWDESDEADKASRGTTLDDGTITY